MKNTLKQPEAYINDAESLWPNAELVGEDNIPSLPKSFNIKNGHTYKVSGVVWNTRGEISYFFIRVGNLDSFMLQRECLDNGSVTLLMEDN